LKKEEGENSLLFSISPIYIYIFFLFLIMYMLSFVFAICIIKNKVLMVPYARILYIGMSYVIHGRKLWTLISRSVPCNKMLANFDSFIFSEKIVIILL
jgi:uncharacterized membrane protein